jgi:hypothetical protein
MQCDTSKKCPARKNPHKPCWEIARENADDYRSFFNVCRDCIVHVLKADNSVLSNREIKIIEGNKLKCRLSPKLTRKPPPGKNVIPLRS